VRGPVARRDRVQGVPAALAGRARPGGIVLKPGPVIEPVRLSVQVFTGRTTGSPVHCLVF
jgi:hypothetical protein